MSTAHTADTCGPAWLSVSSGPSFLPCCMCGWKGPRYDTREAAMAALADHWNQEEQTR